MVHIVTKRAFSQTRGLNGRWQPKIETLELICAVSGCQAKITLIGDSLSDTWISHKSCECNFRAYYEAHRLWHENPCGLTYLQYLLKAFPEIQCEDYMV